MPIQSDNVPELHTLGQWKGLNQQAQRGSIDDDEEWWNENLFAIGPGNLRSCWGHGGVKYTAPPGTQILRMFFGYIGDTSGSFIMPPPGELGWMFLSDGTIDQVDLYTLQVTHVGGPGKVVWQPIAPYYWASAVVWRPSFLGNTAGQQGGVLFGSPLGLYAWDGVTLSSPGDNAPDWLTDQAETDSTSPPTIMPDGLPGIYCMEVFQSRLWVAGKDVISFSAPSNGADFSTTDGGGSFGYFGNKLTVSFMDMAASSNYLFLFGDSSIDMISNVNLSGQGTPESPFITNFSYQNIDPQVGQRYPRPVGRIGRYMQMMAAGLGPADASGTNGLYELQGAEAREIGNRTTNVLNTLDASQFYPTMCPATMFGFRVLLVNGMFTDPWGVKRNLLLMWHPVRGAGGQTEFWSIASQNLNLTNIGAYQDGSHITPFGTDGTSLYQLFAQPDPNLTKKLSTKFLRGQGMQQLTIKNWKRVFMEFYDNDGRGVSFNGQLTCKSGGMPGGVQDIAFELTQSGRYGPAAVNSAFEPYPIQGMGIAAALDISSNSPDFTIERVHILAEERTLWGA